MARFTPAYTRTGVAHHRRIGNKGHVEDFPVPCRILLVFEWNEK